MGKIKLLQIVSLAKNIQLSLNNVVSEIHDSSVGNPSEEHENANNALIITTRNKIINTTMVNKASRARDLFAMI